MKTVYDYLQARKVAFHADASDQFELAEQLKKSADDVRDDDDCKAEAAMFYRAAAEQGHAQAQYELGLMYQLGVGVEKRYFFAARWFRRAAMQGHGEAMCRLAHLYRTGKGTLKGGFTAMQWIRKYAELCAARREDRPAEGAVDCPVATPAGQDQAATPNDRAPAMQDRRGNGGRNDA